MSVACVCVSVMGVCVSAVSGGILSVCVSLDSANDDECGCDDSVCVVNVLLSVSGDGESDEDVSGDCVKGDRESDECVNGEGVCSEGVCVECV